MVELHPRFIVHATCFDTATADDTLIVNIILFNLWLNCGPILWCFRHFYGTDIDVFAYAVTIIVNMTMYNLQLNYAYVLQQAHHILYHYAQGCTRYQNNYEHINVQPMAELRPGFTVCTACFSLSYPKCKLRFTNYIHRKIQLIVELRTVFSAYMSYFYVITI